MRNKLLNISKYLTFSLLVGYIGCEVYLRIYKAENLKLTSYPLVYASDSVVGYRGIPYQKGYIKRPSIEKSFVLNNHGFLGPDFYPEHPDSIFRVMVFGSSYVEGIWGNNKQSFPAIANDLFKKNGYKVEVINCGLSGSNRDILNMALVKEMSAIYHPNLVLLESALPINNVYCFRDFYKGYSITFTGDNGAERAHSKWAAQTKVEILGEHKLVTDIYDLSYCFRSWARASLDTSGNLAHTCMTYSKNCCDNWMYFSAVTTYSYEESVKMVEDLRSGLHNTEFALFEFGDTWLGKKFHEHPEIIHFPFISLRVPLNQKGYSLEHDCHPSELGYNTIAQHLFEELKTNYIPERFAPKQAVLAAANPTKKAAL
jgi:hypothetical protein